MSDTHSHIHCTWPWEMCELMRWQEINVKMQKAIAKLMGLNLTILMQSTKLNLKIWQCSDRSELGKSLEDVWSLIHKRGQLEHVQTFTSKSSDQRISKLFPLSLSISISLSENLQFMRHAQVVYQACLLAREGQLFLKVSFACDSWVQSIKRARSHTVILVAFRWSTMFFFLVEYTVEDNIMIKGITTLYNVYCIL